MVLISHVGRFLPDLVICIHGACDQSLNVSQLLDPLSTLCSLLGTPVSQSALENAELQASSLAAQTTVTQTVTYTAGNVAPTPVGPATASTTTGGQPLTVVTIVATSEAASTATQTLPSTTVYTGLIPVVIIGTDSAGSVYTSTTTEPGAGGVIVQTVTTTNSAGSTYTTTSSSSSGSGSVSSTTTATTSVAAQSTVGSFATSKTSTAPNTDSTNSSPFGYQSAAGQDRVESFLGMAIFFVVVGFWL
jgi:hypothetical protein